MIDGGTLTWNYIAFFFAVGFLAQIVDGALGMAYKVTTSAVLLGLGLPPAVVSGSVHAASSFTSFASGLAHWHLGNVDRKLMLRLLVPGAIGGACGAFLLSSIPGALLKPWISAYLMGLGGYILWRAMQGPRKSVAGVPRGVVPLGFAGGLCDAVGGGGWGPIVTTTLVGNGVSPRFAIGSANAAECFVTITIAGTLLATVGLSMWPIIAALVAGGLVAAPLAALATKHLDEKILMIALGLVILLISGRTLVLAFL
ncbi:MAG: sulfite exporter TauE/SafE family protein [Hyphomicrobiaceae bacterium]